MNSALARTNPLTSIDRAEHVEEMLQFINDAFARKEVNGQTMLSFATLRSEISRLVEENVRNHALSQQMNLVIQSTGVGIWDWYIKTGETIFNERWANIIGYSLDEISPVSIETWMKYAHPEDLEESNRLLQEHWRGETEYYIFESRMKHKEGYWVWVYDTGQVIEWDEEGNPTRMIGTHLDISEQKIIQEDLRRQKNMLEHHAMELRLANEQLERMSKIDPLTNIGNRRAYDEFLEEQIKVAMRNNSPLSLLVIDIDYFKQFNDKYGHDQGDFVLNHVATILKQSLPRTTDFLARIGGEEFVAILPNTPNDGARLVAKHLLDSIRGSEIPNILSLEDRHISVSIGMSTQSGSDIDKEMLFKQADCALYQAKKEGRDCFKCGANCENGPEV